MDNIYILAGTIIVVAIILIVLRQYLKIEKNSNESIEKPIYRYKRKRFFLTRAEHECYDALVAAVGNEYHIFAQVHLPTLLEHTVGGQNWRAALAHINRKSVDFVLCDKAYISPRLAIELDDKSHERPDRQERDREVERMLREAGVPLLRLQNRGSFDPNDLAARIRDSLSQYRRAILKP